jgi:Post-segregation antitoxin CcdA
MARVNITVPDDVIAQARAAGLNVSRLATGALIDELDRRGKVAALDAYLADLEVELGPIPAEEAAAASRWVEQIRSNEPSGTGRVRRRRSA